jgi:hypothetical protein
MNPVALSRASSTASADPHPLPPGSHYHGHGPHGSNSKVGSAPQSTFKNCLKSVQVPPPLQQGGIHIVRVFANGKTKKQYMTLSPDKFTLYITSQPYNPATFGQGKRGSGWFLRRSVSADNHGPGDSGGGLYYGGGAIAEGGAEGRSKSLTGSSSNSNTSNPTGPVHKGNNEVRAIDIGAIHRIQRGHANRRFEMLK